MENPRLQHATMPNDVHTQQPSLNLSRFLNYMPSGILARFRRSKERHLADWQASSMITSLAATAAETGGTTADAYASLQSSMDKVVDKLQSPRFPSAWAFFTSGYMLGLLIVAFILHRVQNVILPSRTPSRPRRGARDFAFFLNDRQARTTTRYGFLRYVMLRRAYAALLPLDISKVSTRLAIQLPSMCLLTKNLVVWLLLVLQACDMMPSWTWIQRLGAWSEQKEMSEICWSTFCAVGSAFCVEGFIRALDGMSTTFTFGHHSNPNASPFNLIGYAFLLHIYSSPVTHLHKPSEALPSRPDKHVIITIAIPLLQLTIFHYLAISKRLSSHRLIPTTLTSLLSLVHFHMTLYSRFFHSNPPTTTTSATSTLSASSPSSTPTRSFSRSIYGFPAAHDLNSNYPLLNYIPNMFESVLLFTIVLTVVLNVIFQLLIRGQIERPFIGLGILNRSGSDERQHTSWLAALRNLPWDEDFGVLLLRMSTASLEATGLRGWGNEVAAIPVPAASPPRRFSRRTREASQETEYGRVRVGKSGVENLTPGRRAVASQVASGSKKAVKRTAKAKGERKKGKKLLEGYQNEIRTIDLGTNQEQAVSEEWRERRLSVERRWLRAFSKFVRVLCGTLRGALYWVCVTSKKVVRRRPTSVVDRSEKVGHPNITRRRTFEELADSTEEEPTYADDDSDAVDDAYARFLRGDSLSDGDSDDASFSDTSDHFESDSSSSDEGLDEGEQEDTPQTSTWEKTKEEARRLLSDLLYNHADEDPSMFLARVSYPRSNGPLTRRRLESVLRARRQESVETAGVDEDEDEDEFERVGPEMVDKKQDDVGEGEERIRHLCVICTVEERDIICWPCRCLTMCDNCRDALSFRSAPSKHRCPCCRSSVEGYSRIYIP